jgi:16S rRNA U1498 N3-methylase RsmE
MRHVRIIWQAAGQCSSVRVPAIDADAFIAGILAQFPKNTVRFTVKPD